MTLHIDDEKWVELMKGVAYRKYPVPSSDQRLILKNSAVGELDNFFASRVAMKTGAAGKISLIADFADLPELNETMRKLRSETGVKNAKLYVVDSDKFFTAANPDTGSIMISRRALNAMTPEETEYALAHAMAHGARKNISTGIFDRAFAAAGFEPSVLGGGVMAVGMLATAAIALAPLTVAGGAVIGVFGAMTIGAGTFLASVVGGVIANKWGEMKNKSFIKDADEFAFETVAKIEGDGGKAKSAAIGVANVETLIKRGFNSKQIGEMRNIADDEFSTKAVPQDYKVVGSGENMKINPPENRTVDKILGKKSDPNASRVGHIEKIAAADPNTRQDGWTR